MRRESVARDWSAGLPAADAPVMFADAALFYGRLPDELGAWPGIDRAAMAQERRRFLYAALDRALDLVELLGRLDRHRWP